MCYVHDHHDDDRDDDLHDHHHDDDCHDRDQQLQDDSHDDDDDGDEIAVPPYLVLEASAMVGRSVPAGIIITTSVNHIPFLIFVATQSHTRANEQRASVRERRKVTASKMEIWRVSNAM